MRASSVENSAAPANVEMLRKAMQSDRQRGESDVKLIEKAGESAKSARDRGVTKEGRVDLYA